MTETEKAYLAGLIDGEGCISLIHKKKATYTARVSVTNTCRSVIDWCLEAAPKGRVKREAYSSLKNWKPVFRAIWETSAARELLADVLPYLIVKKEQAELVLRYYSEVEFTPRVPVSETNRQFRVGFFEKLKQLNCRGIVVGSDFSLAGKIESV